MYLIPVQYHGFRYPATILPKIEEIAGHFDVKEISPVMPYSLHTEYSFSKRNMSSRILQQFNVLREAIYQGIPMLWYSKQWAEEFAEFILSLTWGKREPTIIEIHPPFSNYTSLKEFIDIYTIFEVKIKERYKNTLILIENRCGSLYSKGKFIVSTSQQLMNLVNEIEKRKIELRITLDIPQLLTAHYINTDNINRITEIFQIIKEIKDYIYGIHLWGKKGKGQSHIGDLTSYFNGNLEAKMIFLKCIKDTFDDEHKRFFVPEVNSGEKDLASIIHDLISIGCVFM
ncbi:conserved hypothetical protein [Caldicellulosiruptor hydrothermalis 108]|uniref:Xylose isomerase-like TIM barrel domain-containing protein n=1 Tax=Caldicellulosiruptor hydrothermalis (strain DSM 18901 / VKM B-2411 / 108) TaxID=632292 RepID=E4Q7Z2_CALH1|nr:hypothetical protein [Caldicellulosiruptor hydrothermalis]ADQ07910.1 conserved hypothetical protein [Caldicellulosiruptor hydrothermalis 108]